MTFSECQYAKAIYKSDVCFLKKRRGNFPKIKRGAVCDNGSRRFTSYKNRLQKVLKCCFFVKCVLAKMDKLFYG